MKFNKYIWELYKKSEDGQKAISKFRDRKNWIDEEFIFSKYNPKVNEYFNAGLLCDILEDFWCYKVSEYEDIVTLNSLEDARNLYEEAISTGLMVESEVVLKAGDFDRMLGYVPFISMELNFLFGEYFIPYLFISNIYTLNKLCDTFEIELPKKPKKSDYKARCMYYWKVCEAFYHFRIENGLSPEELSAFIYDFAPKIISNNDTETSLELPKPSRAWFIGGLIRGYDEHWTTGFWQSNPETRRGDILVHYETSPVSAITCLWIAQTDGIVDPFFHYYSNVQIGNKIDLPHISLKELKEDSYFSKHPLVRKNFQGVNGWELSNTDFSELLRIIKDKGYDTATLPRPYAPELSKNVIIEKERDVETKLLEPLLNGMGLYENKDFIRQLPIHAGRGHRIFPDYALHYENKPEEERARVLIEAKLEMKTVSDVEEAFLQAFSYAKLLESSTLILCDKHCLYVYQKRPNFDRNNYSRFYWAELNNSDIYNELCSILK